MTTLGAVFRPHVPPERLRAVATAADEAGLDELWLWEDCFQQGGVAAAAAALAWTGRLRVGVGLLPVPLRNVALTAMEVATLHRMFPGRARIGVGHGVQDWMGQVGARAESPLTLLREYLQALRALLRGERVTTEGRYVRLDGVALDWPPEPADAAVLAGATGPRSLALCGECADGTILTASTTVDGLHAARGLVARGRAAAGRDGPHPVVVYLRAGTGPGAAERVAAEDRAEVGTENSADTTADTSAETTAEGEPGGIGVAGDAATVAAAVRRYAQAGADTVVLQPTADDPGPEGFVRFVATEVRPLVDQAIRPYGD